MYTFVFTHAAHTPTARMRTVGPLAFLSHNPCRAPQRAIPQLSPFQRIGVEAATSFGTQGRQGVCGLWPRAGERIGAG